MYGSSRKLSKFQSVALTANCSSLERQESIKYLGITINQNLLWSDHISNLSKKVNRRIGLIRRLKHLTSHNARITLSNSLVLPLFDYASIIWGDKNNAVLMDHLQVLQNNTARVILDLPRLNSSASKALDQLNWKPLFLRRKHRRCNAVYKCLNGLIDYDFNITKNVVDMNYVYPRLELTHPRTGICWTLILNLSVATIVLNSDQIHRLLRLIRLNT